MAEPANKLGNPPPAGVRMDNTLSIVDPTTARRERKQAQQLQEQKQRTRNEFTAAQLPAPLSNISNQNQGTSAAETTDDQRVQAAERLARRYGSGGEQNEEGDQKKSKKRGALDKLRQARSDLRDLRQLLRGKNIGLFGLIMFTIMAGISLFLDVLPFVTGDLASLVDWILDAGFYFMLFITMVVMTGELMRSMFGFRGIINLAQTILEFIPVSDIIPWHTVAVIVLYLDVKYDIVKIVKNLRKGGHLSFGGSETSG